MKQTNNMSQIRRRSPEKSAKPRLANWKSCVAMIACGMVLVSGLFFAACLHFSSMDYGMKNSRLQRQIEDLEADKKRLILAREISLSPAEIKKAAKKNGAVDSLSDAATPQLASMTKTVELPVRPVVQPVAPKKMVVKTASVEAVATKSVAPVSKPDKVTLLAKRTLAAE